MNGRRGSAVRVRGVGDLTFDATLAPRAVDCRIPAARSTPSSDRNGRRVLSHLTRRVTDVLKDLPSNDGRDECRERVATRSPSLRIHRRKAVSGISLPESGLSSAGSSDPFRPDNLLQTGQSAKSRFFELKCHEAAVGALTQSAMTCRWRRRPNFSLWTPLDDRFAASNLKRALPQLGQDVPFKVAAQFPLGKHQPYRLNVRITAGNLKPTLPRLGHQETFKPSDVAISE